MSKTKLFEELAQPDENGFSRLVSVDEFVDKYSILKFGNGGDWVRRGSSLDKKYIIELTKDGIKISGVKLCGFKDGFTFNQTIRKDIREHYKNQPCVCCGATRDLELDHKDGRKNDERVSNKETQEILDFQPLCKHCNDLKRQICKECKATGKRFNATQIPGNPLSFYKGDENYTDDLGCNGCYWYDVVKYRTYCMMWAAACYENYDKEEK